MDSRDIFNRSRKTIEWEPNWIHIGTENQINIPLIKSNIQSHFRKENSVMLKRGRKNSEVIKFERFQDKIIELIGIEDFELWDEEFNKAIKFNKIGVMNKSKNAI